MSPAKEGFAYAHKMVVFMARIGWVFIAFFAWQAAAAYAGEIRAESLPSKALGRAMPYEIYLPDGYESGRQHYPVLYLLHGAGGDERSWSERGHIREKADQLIASGAIPPAIIVMPGCPACWWVDGAKDKAETAFWSDLVPTIEMRYRTIETRGGRLIAGLSAGGYGAVRFALRYPDRIAAGAALSPRFTPKLCRRPRRRACNHLFSRRMVNLIRQPGTPIIIPLFSTAISRNRSGFLFTSSLEITTNSALLSRQRFFSNACLNVSPIKSSYASSMATTAGRSGRQRSTTRCGTFFNSPTNQSPRLARRPQPRG